MIQIIGTRQSGRTTEIIKLCERLNEEAGYNNTIIVTTDIARAKFIMKMAKELGCENIPMPAPISSIIRQPPTYYERVLIDDMEYVMQYLLGRWELLGYSIQAPKEPDLSIREVNL